MWFVAASGGLINADYVRQVIYDEKAVYAELRVLEGYIKLSLWHGLRVDVRLAMSLLHDAIKLNHPIIDLKSMVERTKAMAKRPIEDVTRLPEDVAPS